MTRGWITGRFFLLFLLLLLSGCSMSPGGELIEQSKNSTIDIEQPTEAVCGSDRQECIWVHICGQVHNPGVYSFQEGSRVFDAVEAAGGFTKYADTDSVNLAMSLVDEGKIYVASKEEREESFQKAQSESDGKLNLNTATLDDLMSLPGIGEKRAESILKLREEKGSFQKVEELLDAEGIKEGIFEQIKDFVKV